MSSHLLQEDIKQTLQNTFSRERYINLMRNIFPGTDVSKAFNRGVTVPDMYKERIETYERIGTYKDPSRKQLDLLIVYLKKQDSLYRARTTQRNFIGYYLKHHTSTRTALVAFVSPNSDTWSLSFVRLAFEPTRTRAGRLSVLEQLTPVKRFSYIIGKGEQTHTAQQQLMHLVTKKPPQIADLIEAFSVETVTDEFFDQYRELYLQFKEELEKIIKDDEIVRQDFKENNLTPGDFAKKTLGQIVFLYFLQKKGWLGVEKGADWGTGSKDFLRRLLNKEYRSYKNFFNDALEPILYEVLPTERHDDYSKFHKCRIPFLNGGLFDPSSYGWVKTDIVLPDELFSNKHQAGIFDVFDRFNFTVHEEEPLEKEVAIDPEILGKVFENLLAEDERKKKGTYYTPRDIVQYMCQESLAHSLYSELLGKVPLQDLRELIQFGDVALEQDAHVEARGYETETYSYTLPESVRTHAKEIDEHLANLYICDPAVGSGAFLVGMMSEIIRTRNVLSPYLDESKKKRTPYQLKLHTIQKSLYGVDIDNSAVEIARLRLWLSLVVDEQDRHEIQPLPNLDCKIMQGDSLLGLPSNEKYEIDQRALRDLEDLKEEYFGETSPNRKKPLKKQIDAGFWKLKQKKDCFDFEINFSEVFYKKNGFDIVLANPPYVRQEAIKNQKPALQAAGFEIYCSTADYFTYFYEKSYQILRQKGVCTFISSNKWMRAKYGEKLRQFFASKTTPLELIDFNGHKVFKATVDTNVLLFQKEKSPAKYEVPFVNIQSDFSKKENLGQYIVNHQEVIKKEDLRASGWSLADQTLLRIKEKIERVGTPLKDWDVKIFYGIKTGFNDAFIIDTKTKERLCKEDPKSAEIIKPILRGRDIHRWHYKWKELWVIFTRRGIDIDRYPAIKKYLSQWKELLTPRNGGQKVGRKPGPYKWYEIQDNVAYYAEFEKEKIIYPNMTKYLPFLLDAEGFYTNQKCFIMTGEKLEFLLSFFNSMLFKFAFRENFPQLQGGTRELSKVYMEQLRIIQPDDKALRVFEKEIRKISFSNGSDDFKRNKSKRGRLGEMENRLNELIYDLYGLTREEIKNIEATVEELAA